MNIGDVVIVFPTGRVGRIQHWGTMNSNQIYVVYLGEDGDLFAHIVDAAYCWPIDEWRAYLWTFAA